MLRTIILIFLASRMAFAAETWTFSSKYDRFTLEYQGGRFLYNGKAVNGEWAEELRPVLENEMNIPCEGLPKSADLRLTWKRGEKTIKRNFYLDAKVASDGTNCLDLTGAGVYYAPFHKFWFVGSEEITISLSQGFEIGSELKTWAKFKNLNGKLVPADDKVAVNYETLNKLKRVLTNLPISGRAHPDIFNDPERNLTARNIIIKAKGNEYKFRQVKGGTWLLQLPKIPWLVLSPNFGFFDSMKEADWSSEFSGELGVVMNKEANVEDRIDNIKKLKAKSSKDVFDAFHQVLWDAQDNEKVKSEIVGTLRFYPSSRNMAALVRALDSTDSPELVHEIIRVLKIRNPKGPQIETNADPEEVEAAVAAWKKWAKPYEKELRK